MPLQPQEPPSSTHTGALPPQAELLEHWQVWFTQVCWAGQSVSAAHSPQIPWWQPGLEKGQSVAPRHCTQLLLVVSQTGRPPEQSLLARQSTQVLVEVSQTWLVQTLAPHCTTPASGVPASAALQVPLKQAPEPEGQSESKVHGAQPDIGALAVQMSAQVERAPQPSPVGQSLFTVQAPHTPSWQPTLLPVQSCQVRHSTQVEAQKGVPASRA